MIHRMDPPADADARADARARHADARARRIAARATTAGWAYEIKWDGVRAIAYSSPGRLRAAEPQPQRHHRRSIPSCAGSTAR